MVGRRREARFREGLPPTCVPSKVDECQKGMGWRCTSSVYRPKTCWGCWEFAPWALRLSFAPANGHLASRRGGGSAVSWHLGQPYFVLFWSHHPPSLCQPHDAAWRFPAEMATRPALDISEGCTGIALSSCLSAVGGGRWRRQQVACPRPGMHLILSRYLTVEVLCCVNAPRCLLDGLSPGLDWVRWKHLDNSRRADDTMLDKRVELEPHAIPSTNGKAAAMCP